MTFRAEGGVARAVEGVDLFIDRGETLGLVGESGCGKSVTSLAIMRLIPQPQGNIHAGSVRYDGRELLELTDKELDMVVKKYPAYKKTVMPAGTYKSWQKPYNAIGFQVYWMAHKKTDPDVVYKMLKTAFSPKNKVFLGKIHKNLKNLSLPLKGMEQMGIPLHAGAVKYYKEQGKSVPAELIVD